ncbi:hypothetical protein D6L41_02550 [Vibrio alginolyticus]|nr:hypothetical protein [Vibrio alginolyticus]
MFIKKIIAFIISAFILGGCASNNYTDFNVYIKNKDPFYPNQMHYFSDVLHIKRVEFGSPSLSFMRFNYVKDNDISSWFISTTYSGKDWLFVEQIKFVVDNKVFTLKSLKNPKREVGYMGTTNVLEKNRFMTPEELMSALSKASSITVRLVGKHYYQEHVLTPTEIGLIKWLHKYITSEIKR